MEKELTTKDLMAINELLTFENWISLKMHFCAENTTDKPLKTMFKQMAKKHLDNHERLLNYLETNTNIGGE